MKRHNINAKVDMVCFLPVGFDVYLTVRVLALSWSLDCSDEGLTLGKSA